LAVGLIGAPTAAGVTAAGAKPLGPTTTAAPPPPPKAFVLVDVDTGNVIDAGNDHTPLPPASLTKVITALAASNLPPATPVTVSKQAAAAPADKISLQAGQVWTADELFHALLISSANDAAVALAEQVGGTLAGFQPVFARTALALGMVDHPVLVDPAGLDGPQGIEGGNLVSARDLAIAGRELLAVPYLAAIVATPIYRFVGPGNVAHRLTSHNYGFLATYPGAVGVKTGFTNRAGSCVMAAARAGGRTMLAVVLNSSNPDATAKTLLNQGFATPVEGESPADQLPPVNLDALLPPAAATNATLTPTSAGPAPGQALAPPRSDIIAAAAPAPGPPWVPTGVALLALMICVGLLVGQRRAVRRRSRDQPNLWA
jgi:D-alanyl-D-alanine carboxypeptidase